MEFGVEVFTDTALASDPAQLGEGIRRSKRNTQSQVPLHMRGQMRYRLEEVAATQRSHQEEIIVTQRGYQDVTNKRSNFELEQHNVESDTT